jgi:hypothetical protein
METNEGVNCPCHPPDPAQCRYVAIYFQYTFNKLSTYFQLTFNINSIYFKTGQGVFIKGLIV